MTATGAPPTRPKLSPRRLLERFPPLTRLRMQLTAWYVGTFALILLALGALLFSVIAHQTTRDLIASLRLATTEIERAAETRERESVATGGSAVDAVEELRIPERDLYLFDVKGSPITPDTAIPVLRAAAADAGTRGALDRRFRLHHERTFELHAERFTLSNGKQLVALATADRVELEDKYAALIALFAGLSAAALLLVAVGGWLLAAKSVAPVEASLAHMRRFMADAAHELRTPIAVLRTRAEVALQRERDVETYVSALDGVGREAKQLGSIVEDLLTLARADAGERPLRRELVQLDEIVLESVGAIGAIAERAGVRLDVESAEEAAIVGDGVMIRQLALILLDNAIKFTPAGGHVSAGVRARNGHAELEVQDTGAGIVPEDLPRVFDRFFRSESARGHASGAGLGLSIARWIADAHGASIRLESTVGAGTLAIVRFPIAEVPDGPASTTL